jgi:hypothetical protein
MRTKVWRRVFLWLLFLLFILIWFEVSFNAPDAPQCLP